MTYTKIEKQVTIEMTDNDFSTLMFIMGMATAAAGTDLILKSMVLKFTNELNRTNPEAVYHQIPDVPSDG